MATDITTGARTVHRSWRAAYRATEGGTMAKAETRRDAVVAPTGPALEAIRRELDWPIQCTACGMVDDLDAYDVGGLDEGHLACNACGHIGPMRDLADYSYRGEDAS